MANGGRRGRENRAEAAGLAAARRRRGSLQCGRDRRDDAMTPRETTPRERPGRPDPSAAATPAAAWPAGVSVHPGFFDRAAQEALLAAIRDVARDAPLYVPRMPGSGRPLSVRMTNCGRLGWVSDAAGYRYQPRHPETGRPWPPIPDLLLAAWASLAPGAPAPEACLVNFYGPQARMGLHQDRDEQAIDVPVVSLSLGDTCLFRIGGATRGGATQSLRLASGDAVVLGGAARLAFHGVDRIYPATSDLLPRGGRINLTLRRVTLPQGR